MTLDYNKMIRRPQTLFVYFTQYTTYQTFYSVDREL